MFLEKVLILPTDDAVLASALLRSFLKIENVGRRKVALIVFGDDARARNAVMVADSQAVDVTLPRWVIWVRSRKAAKAALQELKILESGMLKDWQKTMAVSVNFKATICGVVSNETDLSNIAAVRTFLLAENENATTEGTATVIPLPETLD